MVARCFRETLELFQRAAEGKGGREALQAIGQAYAERLWAEPGRLQLQMQAYAARDDPDFRRVVRDGVRDLFAHVERVGALADEEHVRFFRLFIIVRNGQMSASESI